MTMDRIAAPQAVRERGFSLSVPNQVLAVLCLMYLVLYVDRVTIATVAPRMMADLHLSNIKFGLAVSAFSYPLRPVPAVRAAGSATGSGRGGRWWSAA